MKAFIRNFTAVTLIASFALASAQEFDWRSQEGEDIRFLMNRHPFSDWLEPLIPEFEELTGISVTLEIFPEDQFRQRRLLEVGGGASTLDGYMFMPGQAGAQYTGAGWLLELDDLIADESLTHPDLDLEDFFGGAMDSFETEAGLIGLPLQIESSLLFYRKDLFEAAGLDGPPETLDQLLEYAEVLHGDGVAGFAMRGQGAAATSQIVNLLYSFGGQWQNEDGSSALGSEESQAALEYYANLLTNYGPPGPANLHWAEVMGLYAQGQVAMVLDANVFRSIVEDPQQSIPEVIENTGYGILPAGPAGSVPAVLTWGLSINAATEKPEASWLFVQWALSKENQLSALLSGVPSARESSWQAPEFTETAPQDWNDASRESFNIGQGDWNPPIIPVPEARDAYGQAIVAALQGRDVGPALEQAVRDIDLAVERTR